MKKVKMFMTGILALGVSLIVVSVVLGAIRMFVMDGDDMSECDDRHFREYYLRPGLKGEEGRFSIFTAEEFPRYARLFKTQEVLKEVKYTKSDMIVLTHNLKLRVSFCSFSIRNHLMTRRVSTWMTSPGVN